MFNKDDIKRTIKQLKLSPEDYILLMGGSMVIKGYRETTQDLDIQIISKKFWELSNGKTVEKAKWTDNLTFSIGDIELFEMNDDIVPYEIVNGITVQTDNSIIEWKTNGGREKDLRDIELIRKSNPNYIMNIK